MRLRNLTPHVLHIHVPDAPVFELSPDDSGPARVEVLESPGPELPIDGQPGIPTRIPRYGAPTNLPEPTSGVVLVVSQMVAAVVPERSDIAWPGEAIRDAGGRVIGCRGLSIHPFPHAGGR